MGAVTYGGTDVKTGVFAVKEDDLEALADCYAATFNAPPWNDAWTSDTACQRLRELYDTPGFCGLADWEDGRAVSALLGAGESYFDGKVFRITELWTDSAYRSKGFAKALVLALEQRLCEDGYKRIYLITLKDPSTLGFYELSGFSGSADMCVLEKDIKGDN